MNSTTPIDVLIVSHSAEFIGGSEKSILKLAQHLKSNGKNVAFCLPAKGTLLTKLQEEHFLYFVIPYSWAVNNRRHEIQEVSLTNEEMKRSHADQNLHATIAISELIKEHRVKCLVTNTGTIPWGAIASKISGIPHAWFIREFGEEDFGLDFGMSIEARSQMIDKFSDFVLFNSQTLASHFEAYIPKDKVRIIYPSFDRKPRMAAGWAPKKKVKLAIVGSITPGKGQLTAIKAMEQLVKNGATNYSLSIAGAVGDQDYFKKLNGYINRHKLEQFVHILGTIERIDSLYKKTDILIICSKKEAFGRTIVEAMLNGVPVLAPNEGSPNELINDRVTGYLYSANSVEDLVEKIQRIANDDSEVRGVIQEAYRHASEHYTQKPLEIFEETINLLVDLPTVAWLAYFGNDMSVLLKHFSVLQSLHSQFIEDIERLQAINKGLETELNKCRRSVTETLSRKVGRLLKSTGRKKKTS